ncbi:hypothetical protein, partial [Klebsiella pneumoniae]|uniref:hypothetical protein n=1 Tax=Klebsiella pneumoniae TaxID=573 RepID=UPI003EE1A1B6
MEKLDAAEPLVREDGDPDPLVAATAVGGESLPFRQYAIEGDRIVKRPEELPQIRARRRGLDRERALGRRGGKE